MSFMEKAKAAVTAPVEAKAIAYASLILSVLALGIAFGMLLSVRSHH